MRKTPIMIKYSIYTQVIYILFKNIIDISKLLYKIIYYIHYERAFMNKKIIIYLVLLFFILNGIVYIVTEKSAAQRIQLVLDENVRTLKTHYELLLESQKNIAETVYQSTAAINRVIEIMTEAQNVTKEKKAILRVELQKLLNSKYDIIKQKHVLQYQFVFPNNESFLRMHKPEKFGDDLSDIRADFKYTNETQKPVRTFTQGRTTHAFRNTFPIFDKNNNYIGALEISFSSEYFQWYLNNVSHIHSHFVVRKDIFSAKTWERDDVVVKYSQSAENIDYMISLGGLHSKEKCIVENETKLATVREEIDTKMLQGNMFSTYSIHLEHVDVFSFLPIKDLDNKTVAWLVSYQTNSFILLTFKIMMVMRLVTLVFSLILIYFIVQLLRSKALLAKEHEETIDKNERMELALLGYSAGVYEWDMLDNTAYYSAQWMKMLGYKEDELPGLLSTWQKRVHPDDIEAVMVGVQRILDETGTVVETIHRLQHRDGKWIWILGRGLIEYDEKGKPIRMVGIHTDITEQKNIELKHTQQEQVIEQIHDSVIATDLDGIITSCNHGTEVLLDYKNDELIGKHITMLYLKEDFEALGKNIEILMQNEEHSSIVRLVKKSKKIVDINLSLSILKDEYGKPIGMVGYSQDITKRKKAEDELKEQHKYLQSIIDGVDDPIMVIKEDYTIELMNESLQLNVENTNIADPEHPKCYEISHHRSTPCDGFDHPCPLREVMESKQHTTVIHNHEGPGGDKRYVELSATPLFDKEKNCIGIIESARDITSHLEVQDELREQKNILHYQAHHDALTGLANRVLFNDRLEQAIEKAKRSKTNLALLFIDLDHFKEINDSLGHAVGDEILKDVTSRLRETIRDEDTLARLGGDEFTIILENLAQGQDASVLAQKILQVLSKPITIEDNELYISSSIGISLFPQDGASAANLLKYADSAMYKAKDSGRDNFQFYSAEMTELAFERVIMESALRAALVNEEFVVHFQPQVDAIENRLTGMEALVRWRHPTMGLVSPAKFIPLAEATGLIIEIDQYVMKTAMIQMTEWVNRGLCPGILYMNLAVKQLQKKDFVEMFKNLMKETQCRAECIGLEVTESQIMTNPEDAVIILKQISDIGIELAIDDFGTGYSSLSYLKKLPIDKLKIDQSFIRELPDDEEDAGITRAVIALAKSLNMKIIAEGVETVEQKEFLIENGCKDIQGYYYSKPVSAHEMEEILMNGLKV